MVGGLSENVLREASCLENMIGTLYLHCIQTKSINHSQTIFNELCLFVLRCYGLVNSLRPCRARSVYLTTLLLGRLSPLSSYSVLCTYFRQKLTPTTSTSWISRRERNTVEYISWSISAKECSRPGGGRIHNLLITSRTRIQLNQLTSLRSIIDVQYSALRKNGLSPLDPIENSHKIWSCCLRKIRNISHDQFVICWSRYEINIKYLFYFYALMIFKYTWTTGCLILNKTILNSQWH